MITGPRINPSPELCLLESVFRRRSVENLSPCLICTKAVSLSLSGFFIGGPSNMISSAISADLGRQDLVRGSSEALATVTGIVDGTGSIGAAVGQVRLQSTGNEAEGLLWLHMLAYSSVGWSVGVCVYV